MKAKCYLICDKLVEVTDEELSRNIEGLALSGWPIYINGNKTDICIYTVVSEHCALLIGCRIYSNVTYSVDDIKKLNRLGIIGKKIYDNNPIEA